MDTYDPDEDPTSDAWTALTEGERIELALRHHAKRAGDALHTESMNPMMHASLHAVVETQVVSRSPSATGEALERLLVAGLKRHAAVHAIMRELAVGLAALHGGGRFDQAGYVQRLATIQPADVIAAGIPRAHANEATNRAQRRADKKAKKGKTKR